MEAMKVAGPLKHIKNYVRLVYKCCVEAVNPKFLLKRELVKQGNSLLIRDNEFKIANNCYVVGFGKAVLNMAVASEEIIGNHIRGGAISIPEGILSETKSVPTTIQVFEGAKHNLADEKSFKASKSIMKIVENLKEEDMLIVLISGGGSALLTHPVPPVTLEEKLFVTKELSKAGANISELNAVRKRLSLVKGGGLTKLAYPAKVMALIISDVVNDPVDVIASGPTVPDKVPSTVAIDVLKKFNLIEVAPPNVLKVLTRDANEESSNLFNNSVTYIIGNNTVALKAGESFAAKDDFMSIMMTSSLVGQVDDVAVLFAKLAGLLCQALGKTLNSNDFSVELNGLSKDLSLNQDVMDKLTTLIYQPSSKNKICLLFGGETTVKVLGQGVGGRNQELALRFSLAIDELSKTLHVIDLFNIVMLCGGTDGADGLTDAAGAVAYNGQTVHALQQNINPKEYLKDNNSYNYYSLLNNGEDIIKCGMTGTNVMDVDILTIEAKR